MYIPIILGTAREGRQSEKVANFILSEVLSRGYESEILDVRNYRLQATDNSGNSDQAKMLSEKVLQSGAIIIVSPEYNHGYPGELKMMLDMLYKDWYHKPFGICGVSSGIFGGARMMKQLQQVCIELRMIPSGECLYFGKVQELFDESGKIKDEAYKDRVEKFLKELISFVV